MLMDRHYGIPGSHTTRTWDCWQHNLKATIHHSSTNKNTLQQTQQAIDYNNNISVD